jgi:hypothetical protein
MNIEKLLEKLYTSESYYKSVDEEINEIAEKIHLGYAPEKINRDRNPEFKYLFEFAKSRIRVSRKFSEADHLFLDYYSSLYSTPEIVGKYRGNRLKGQHIIDAGSGAGMQDIMFSLSSDVSGIEINRSRYLMSMLNRKPYGSDANFLCEDFFDYNGDFKGKIIFSDPLRPQNSREKFFSQLSPDPVDIIKERHGIAGYAIDLPPHMRWENIPLQGEKEYISLNGNLNRLTLYSPSISLGEATAVLLPENRVISGKPEEFQRSIESDLKNMEYIFVPDISVVSAGLLNMVIDPDWKLIYSDSRRSVLSGNSIYEQFAGKQYAILDYSTSLDILPKLKKFDAGKIYFRFSIQPEETYRYKNKIEPELNGKKNIYIFKSNKKYIITEELE